MLNNKSFKLPALEQIASAEEARDLAIDWQKFAAEQSLSYGELAQYALYFETLAEKFNLTAEFRENAII